MKKYNMKKSGDRFDFLKYLVNSDVDGISFMQERKSARIDGLGLTKDEPFIKNNLGYLYTIVLYKMNRKTGDITDLEKFESTLTGPEVYIENLIKCGFSGFILKKTEGTSSDEYVDFVYDKLCKLMLMS